MLQNIQNVSGEELKTKELSDDNVQPSNDTILNQINATEIPQQTLNKETEFKEEFVAVEDKIPTFLSEIRSDEDVFIPSEPSDGLVSKITADPFAAADMINANKDPESQKPAKKSSGLSLFERVTGVSRGNKKLVEKVEQDTTQTEGQKTNVLNSITDLPVVQTNSETENIVTKDATETESSDPQTVDSSIDLEGEMDISDRGVIDSEIEESNMLNEESIPESIDNSSEEAIETGLGNPQSLLGDLDPADRLSGAQNDDETLDIPAFLRRQAN